MSLYRFFESSMEECPELLTASGKQYNDTYSFFKNKTRKLPIDNYLKKFDSI